jgi:hypothetical protein
VTTKQHRLTPAELAARINELIQATTALARPWSDAELRRDPADGWSGTRILAHVAEVLPYWARQAARVAGREERAAPFGRTHEDPDRIAAVERHAGDTKEELLAAIAEGEREAWLSLHSIPGDRWERTGTHARRGEMSVTQIVQQFLLDHLEEHRAQLAAILSDAARA